MSSEASALARLAELITREIECLLDPRPEVLGEILFEKQALLEELPRTQHDPDELRRVWALNRDLLDTLGGPVRTTYSQKAANPARWLSTP
ncbi:MAG: hypothetical protein KC910_14255 [Candidatus Eremiobacteraeota bacterium]|nr:hypothetical protein [Candidatus Eremiobacteraeota bacterium]